MKAQVLENLCSEFRATGMDVNGGYAEYMKVQEKYAYPVLFPSIDCSYPDYS